MNHYYDGYHNQGQIAQDNELRSIKDTLSQLTNKDIPIILSRINNTEQQIRGIYGQLNQIQQDLTAIHGRLGRCNC